MATTDEYDKAASDIRRSGTEQADGVLDARELIRHATLAASSHNTQPWKFRIRQDSISILPDFSRRCPAVDPDDHHLYASLGCAAENLLLAAQAAGLRGRCSYGASNSSLQVNLEEATPSRSPLFEAIPSRQCSRVEYDGTELSGEELSLLQDAGRGSAVSLMLLTANKPKEQVAEYVAAGNTAQFGDPRWAEELKSWVRFNARDAMRTGDGLYGPV
ncbi:MAG TPA: Tat pathway signal protein, partial [Burkholderiales bacterium]